MNYWTLLFLSLSRACVPDYEQCGGRGYSGDSACCLPGSACVEVNPYWYQCEMATTLPTMAPTIAPTSTPASSCDETRKSITDPSNIHTQTFIDGVVLLKQSGVYDELTKQHGNASTFFRFHKNVMFLPWHRWYVWQLEDQIRKVTGKCFAMPYWEWSSDAVDPLSSTLWTLIGEANTGGGCLTSGPFVDFRGAYDGECIRRNTSAANARLFSQAELQALLKSSSNMSFVQWSHEFEDTAHAQPHLLVGEQMSSMPAPDDPLFYLHHAFTDLVFSSYLACRPNDTAIGLHSVFLPFGQNVTVADSLELSITYDSLEPCL